MLPFIAPLVMVLLDVNNSRLVAVGSASRPPSCSPSIAAFDLPKVPRLGIVELAIAAAARWSSLARRPLPALAGRYRAARSGRCSWRSALIAKYVAG